MKIPKKFKLMGQTINVVFNKSLVEDRDFTGSAKFRANTIEIQPETDGIKRSNEQIGQTFCHELIHFIFSMLSEHKLCQNEKLVDTIGGLLYQALETMEYENTKKI